MFKRLSATALLAFIAGCTGGDSFKPSANISHVEPNVVASGRSARVEINGNFTKWKESNIVPEDVTFGAGITVDAVTISNPGLLFVDITVASDAAPGVRDIDVDGEMAVGAFSVIAPFELSVASVSAGGYAFIEIFGNGTDWLAGLTNVTFGTDEIVVDGSDYYAQTGVAVVSPEYLQAIVKVDLFAVAGDVSVTVNGVTVTDTAAGALAITTVTPTVLDVSANAAGSITAGNEVQVFSIPAGLIGDSVLFEFVEQTTASDIDALVYDESDGVNPIFNTYAGEAPFDQFFFGNGAQKDYFIVIQELSLAGGDIPFEYDVTFDSLTPVALATQLAAQQLAAVADENWYHIVTDKWAVATVDITSESVTSTLRPFLTARQDGTALPLQTFQAAVAQTNLTAAFLQLPGGNALVGLRDFSNTSNGADSAYTIAWSQDALGEETIDSGITTSVPVPDNNPQGLSLSIDPDTGFTSVDEINLGLQIRHTWRSDLVITLTSPSGIVEDVLVFAGGSSDDWITTVGPNGLLAEDGDFTSFTGETNPDGIWTLYIEDTAGGDVGFVDGWALGIDGSQ